MIVRYEDLLQDAEKEYKRILQNLEIMDKYEGMALKEEEKLKAELRDFKKSAEYKQYVSNVSTAKIALKGVQDKLEEEKKILQEEDRKGAEMRATSDKIQKGYRDQRLFKPNVPLKF